MKKLIAASLLAARRRRAGLRPQHAVTVTLQSVLDMPEAQGKLDGSVKFYLAGSPTPKVVKKFGEDTSNAKTNAFNKSAEEACRWNALSALIKLQDNAKRDGANAVIDITSYNKKMHVQQPDRHPVLRRRVPGRHRAEGHLRHRRQVRRRRRCCGSPSPASSSRRRRRRRRRPAGWARPSASAGPDCRLRRGAAFAASRALLRELLHEAPGVRADAWDVSAQAGDRARGAPAARRSR